ncbi:MAG: hypothetical protein COC09_03440 [Gammaproteobacteria bacterium]|nr:PilZ domain-containing protein [Gammaproteobacteria bacterium]PCH62694.1 MAG: hypothetical protein COC09_07705 [Gammaproteobacteria bacterium]PCH64139.1 MAG: hypothetical protein COC09_03440 [Gammaproteobacteria bacterium]
MTNASNSGDHLGQRLVFEESLPLSYKVVEMLPQGNEHVALQISNEETLHAIMMVEDTPKENSDDSNVDAQDILRLEYKINVMFELLVGLYQREAELPLSTHIILRSDAIQWHNTDSLEIGSNVLVDLYMSRKYPKPLVLAGTVTSVSTELPSLLTMTFADAVSERIRDWIDKFIFRHHRRSVALARRQLSGSD